MPSAHQYMMAIFGWLVITSTTIGVWAFVAASTSLDESGAVVPSPPSPEPSPSSSPPPSNASSPSPSPSPSPESSLPPQPTDATAARCAEGRDLLYAIGAVQLLLALSSLGGVVAVAATKSLLGGPYAIPVHCVNCCGGIASLVLLIVASVTIWTREDQCLAPFQAAAQVFLIAHYVAAGLNIVINGQLNQRAQQAAAEEMLDHAGEGKANKAIHAYLGTDFGMDSDMSADSSFEDAIKTAFPQQAAARERRDAKEKAKTLAAMQDSDDDSAASTDNDSASSSSSSSSSSSASGSNSVPLGDDE